MTSQEVLAPPPPPPRHPVRRVVAAAVVLGVVGAAVVVKLTSGADDPPQPPPAAGAPPSASPTGPDLATAPDADPPADGNADVLPFYPPTPIDGQWVSGRLSPAQSRAIVGTRPRQRLTLEIRTTSLFLWGGTRSEPKQRIIGYEAIYVEGHRVQLNPIGYSQDNAVYRWRIRDHGRRLGFALLRRTDAASPTARLVTVPFVRRP